RPTPGPATAATATSARSRGSSPHPLEAVAHAPHRDDVARVGRVLLNLLAQPADVRRDGTLVAILAPEPGEELRAASRWSRANSRAGIGTATPSRRTSCARTSMTSRPKSRRSSLAPSGRGP